MVAHSSVLACRIPGTGEPGGDLAAAAAADNIEIVYFFKA